MLLVDNLQLGLIVILQHAQAQRHIPAGPFRVLRNALPSDDESDSSIESDDLSDDSDERGNYLFKIIYHATSVGSSETKPFQRGYLLKI
jgi:hypothetical protein